MKRLVGRHLSPLRASKMTVDNKRKFVTIEDFFSKTKKPKNETVESKKKLNASDGNTSGSSFSQEQVVVKKKSKEEFQKTLSSMLSDLLLLEIDNIELSWFLHLQSEFKKPYFVKLKQFVKKEQKEHTVFPPPVDIYSWTRLTPFDQVRVVIIGQDPYHNYNQAHGLAFSVKPPTPTPPSLKNIYKELQSNYKDFKIDNSVGDLTPWALQGVLLLNTALTVRAHNANSHSKQGWETFTRRAIEALIKDREGQDKSLIFLLWGSNAQKSVESLLDPPTLRRHPNIKVFKSVHPSPLSAQRGFFGNNHFRQINDWLYNDRGEKMIDWSVVRGSQLKEVVEANEKLDSNV
ncbi:uracil DNA glycosylase [Zygosaccharomyces mellis]|uniref:Uracil-DNA glycosylase n=1 Tax=Zygosaccharomyces mellis TaxID=42258 RepID=A0A4C2E155_9SACH|nr:uracil DNA glycosylase [Zygosaccharomyces mellis]